jgi:hypothetical protein
MSTSTQMEQTQKTADRIRDELVTTLRELDRRRQRAMDLRYELVESWGRVALAFAGVAVALVGGAVIGTRAFRRRPTALRKQRVKALRRAWAHPRRIASKAEGKPLPVVLGRKVAMAFVTAFAARFASQAAQRAFPDRRGLVSLPG